MTALNTYITFKGNCQAAFEFYKNVFGGKFIVITYFRDMPNDQSCQLKDEDNDKVMHVSLPISESSILMGSDVIDEATNGFIQGNNFSVSINADSKNDADRLFTELSIQGNASMPMQKTFWGSYFGMLTDQFGIQWMVSFDESQGNH